MALTPAGAAMTKPITSPQGVEPQQQLPGAAAPEVGDIFEYGTDMTGAPRRYRVTGWLRPVRATPDALDLAQSGALPDEYGGAEALTFDELLRELLDEEPSPPAPGCEPLQHCSPATATHVSGTGVSGVIARISEVRVVDKVNWPPESIQRDRDRALRSAREGRRVR